MIPQRVPERDADHRERGLPEHERILEAMGVPNPEQAVRTGGYRITTTLDYPLQQAAKELGVDLVISKPFDLQDFLNAVRGLLLGRKRT